MQAALEKLLRDQPLLWRGRELQGGAARFATGHAALDAALPGGGWPGGAVVEIVARHWGSGGLRLLLPALAAASSRQQVVWVAPPYIPYPPALAAANVVMARVLTVAAHGPDILWAGEKLLASPACGMVLLWPPSPRAQDIRRLQLAAQAGGGTGFIFCERDRVSPAALRLALEPRGDGLRVHIRKARGSCQRGWVDLDWPAP